MNYGLYLAAGGAISNLYRQDVIANNLANVNTVGFKPDDVYFRQRLPERLESGAPVEPKYLLEQLGGGRLVNPPVVKLRQGSLTATGNTFDLAIQGEGFFAVSDRSGGGEESIRLTRDGRFTLNDRRELVMATTGLRLLDVDNRTVRLDHDGEVSIRSDGSVVQDGGVVATIQLTAPLRPQELAKLGDNLLKLPSNDPAQRRPAGGRFVQHHLESSAVDPLLTLNALIGVAKAAQANLKMMQYHDHIMGQAINTLGRVS